MIPVLIEKFKFLRDISLRDFVIPFTIFTFKTDLMTLYLIKINVILFKDMCEPCMI